MECFASPNTYRQYRSTLRARQYVGKFNFDARNLLKFVGWVFSTLRTYGPAGKTICNVYALLLKYYGLSGSGLDLLANFGWATPRRMLHNFESQLLLASANQRYLHTKEH